MHQSLREAVTAAGVGVSVGMTVLLEVLLEVIKEALQLEQCSMIVKTSKRQTVVFVCQALSMSRSTSISSLPQTLW
jgi:hypothetical protein